MSVSTKTTNRIYGKNKTNLVVLISIILLFIIVGVTAYLNKGDLALKRELQDNAIISLKNGDIQVQMDLKKILKLQVKDFETTKKSSGEDPYQIAYTGVLLKDVFNAAGFDITNKNRIIVKAVDGYTVILTVQEVMEDDNVYLTFKKNDKPLGKKEDGGLGPYQIVIRKDAFSQRWCKFVTVVEVI